MKKFLIPLFILMLVSVLASCNLPSKSTPTVAGPDALLTVAAKTVDAMSTQLGSSSTDLPSTTLSPKQTISPPSTTTTPPSLTQQAQQTVATTIPCDQAAYVRDVTIPDGTLFMPGTSFTKTWEIKNTGTCAWDGTYSIVFGNEGDIMGGSLSTPIISSGSVAPGDTVKISVNLVAPANEGDFKGYWTLRNPSGSIFFANNKSIWVAIKVISYNNKFPLVGNTCNALWRNSTSADAPALPCPGKEGSSQGYVYTTNDPKFYTRADNEASIVAAPQQVNDGMIFGEFPPVLIPSNARLLSFAGCGEKMDQCNADITITAQIAGGQENVLKEWNQVPQEFNMISIDLGAANLTGQNVVFRFYIRANGSPTQDKIVLLGPFILPKQ